MPDLYSGVAERAGTGVARELARRLSVWHDRMVMHERRRRLRGLAGPCPEGCPHAVAADLWTEALVVFGADAHQLQFLRSRAVRPGPGRRLPDATASLAGSGAAR